MQTLFEPIEPFDQFFLETNSIHRIYVEQCGNPNGVPILFLHGGPCSGCKPDHRRFFDPHVYRIILFDQRGCGRSLPFGELNANSLQTIIDDMERIRQVIDLTSWILYGGSWGATLALAYAQKYTQSVQGMILRGTFLARQQDLEWFLGKNGVRLIYPEMSDLLVNSIPTLLRTQNLLADIITTLNSDDEQAVRSVTKAWQLWGGQVALGSLFQPPEMIITEQDVMQAKTELHYAQHHYFLADNQLLANCHILQHIPTMIIHGRNDLVCPLEAGWQLHKHLPHSQFILLPNSGHIAQGEEMIDALVSATEAMKNIR